MRLRRVWLPCVLGSAFGTAACSILLPFDELSDGVRDAAVPPDATFDVGVDQASPGEAGVDAPSVETSIPDAGADVSAPVDAGAVYPDGSWCSTQPPGMVLCDDFDYEDGGFERWTTTQFDVQGAARFSDVAESPPHSFEVDMPAVSPNTFYIEALEEVVPPAVGTSALSMSFSFQPAVAFDAGSYQPYIASISQGPGAPRYALGLNVGPGGVNFGEQDTAVDGDASFPPEGYVQTILPSGTWTHVVIDVDFAAETASLSVDGTVAATLSLQGAWSASATTAVYLGDWYVGTTAGFDVLYDDVVVRQH